MKKPVKVIVLCTLLYTMSSTNNVIGKMFLQKYPYPMTLSLFHMLANSLFLYPALLLGGVKTNATYSRHFLWRFMLPLGLGKLLGSVASHVSIWRVSVSYAHTIKASLPIFTMILARIIQKEKQSLMVLLSLVPIIIGIGIATATEISFEIYGMISALTATFIFAVQNIYTKMALKEIKIGPLQLLLKLVQVSFLICIPLWIFVDTPIIAQDINLQTTSEYVEFLGTLSISGTINFLQNILAFSILHLLSSLSYSVTNATKRILVITVSLITLRNPVTMLNFIGMMVAVAGVFLYNRAKIYQNARLEELPTTISEIEDKNYVSPRYISYNRMNGFI